MTLPTGLDLVAFVATGILLITVVVVGIQEYLHYPRRPRGCLTHASYLPFDPEKDILVFQTDRALTEAQRECIVACWKQAMSEGRVAPSLMLLERMQIVVLGRGKEATGTPTIQADDAPKNPVS